MNYQDGSLQEITIRRPHQPVCSFSAFGNLSQHFLTFHFFGKPAIYFQDISSRPKIAHCHKRRFIVWQISFDAHLINLASEVCDGAWTLFFKRYSILHVNDCRKPEQREWCYSKLGPSRRWNTTAVLFTLADFRNETVKPTQTLSDVIIRGHLHLYKELPGICISWCVFIRCLSGINPEFAIS